MASTDVCILQLNVGLTRAKRDAIRHLADQHHANVILFPETHCESDEKLHLEGYDLISFIAHKKHGIATYAKQGIDARAIDHSSEISSIQWLTMEAL